MLKSWRYTRTLGDDSKVDVRACVQAFVEAVDAGNTSRLLSVPSGSLHLGEVSVVVIIVVSRSSSRLRWSCRVRWCSVRAAAVAVAVRAVALLLRVLV
jgi:hypothetical protein